jgi:hypothetical protein
MSAPRSQHATLAIRLAALTATAALVLAVGQSTPASDPHAAHAAPAMQATATPTPGPSSYLETFSVETDHPLSYKASGRMDILVRSRDMRTWRTLDPMALEHGANCEAPPAVHDSGNPMSYDDAVFSCKDHVMTAPGGFGGYELAYMMPSHMADFSNGEAVIRWDVSSFSFADRDWWDVWVTPYEDFIVAPLDPNRASVDVEGPPKRGVHIMLEGLVSNGRNFHFEEFNSFTSGHGFTIGAPLHSILTPSASRRDTYEIRLTQTTIKFCLVQFNYCFMNQALPTALDWNKGVVQLGHHSYDPKKDCSVTPCGPGTWHWDNFSIAPSQPFTIIPATSRWAYDNNLIAADPVLPSYSFAEPAPADAELQMLCVAVAMEISLDNGSTWATLPRMPAMFDHWGAPHHFRGPIPVGTTHVKVRGTQNAGASGPDCNHAVITSLGARQAGIPTNTPAPTNTPLPTPTPPPPTATNTPAPTNTPTNTPTPGPLTIIRVNAGGAQFTDGASNVWAADTGSTGGAAYSGWSAEAFAGTTDDTLYGDVRYENSGGSFSYAFTVPNGTYDVKLLFAEGPGNTTRIFDVSAEGAVVINDLNVQDVVGNTTAYTPTFAVAVSDGTLNLVFTSVSEHAMVSAIEVIQQTPPTPTPVPATNTPTPTLTPTPTVTLTPTLTPTPTPQPECRDHVRDERSWSSVLADWLPWTPVYEPMACP